MLRKDIVRPLEEGRRTASECEIAKFDALALEWWKPDGKFKTVHAFNAVRVDYIGRLLTNHLGSADRADAPLNGVRILDAGCGAGLVSEPVARLGAEVTGIDASAHNIAIARRHALSSGLEINYHCATPEELSASQEPFDAVLSLEVVEHVADLPAFLTATASLVRPGGLLVIGTLNRTALSYALAIVGAEYVLRWLPKGTHEWKKFVKPGELISHLSSDGFTEFVRQGVAFNPATWQWGLGRSSAVNYLSAFRKTTKRPRT